MTAAPPVWERNRLQRDIGLARDLFRRERVEEPLQQYLAFYDANRRGLEELLGLTADLSELHSLASEVLSDATTLHLARYLASPPISVDDLTVLADTSLAPTVMRNDPEAALCVVETILLALDRERFPWVPERRSPTATERNSAIVATSAMRAFRQVETARRRIVKKSQEDAVKGFLETDCGFSAAPTRSIENISKAPPPGHYCGETLVGSRRADVPVRLWDGRLMPIECKVSNSETNSYKRINNDAAIKASVWRDELGSANCVPAAVLSGVFGIANLEYAQHRRLTLFWAHSLHTMRAFVEATR